MSAFDAVGPSKEYKRALWCYQGCALEQLSAFLFAAVPVTLEVVSLFFANNCLAAKTPQFFMPLFIPFPETVVPEMAGIAAVSGIIALGMAKKAQKDLRYANLRVKGAKRGRQKAQAKQDSAAGPS